MKTPRLALNLAAATLMAAAGPARADALHSPGWADGVGHAKPLSSNLVPHAAPAAFHGLPHASINAGASPTGHIEFDLAYSRARLDARAGASAAAPMLGGTPRGTRLANVSQVALDHERAQVRDGVGRARLVPQVSLGTDARF
jgi:hypothetical protein